MIARNNLAGTHIDMVYSVYSASVQYCRRFIDVNNVTPKVHF